ncbi:glycosyltransferase involved in cell wall biosynthesis [Gillisia sp. Hel_I_86]|uniref:DUF2062 domain-containing protein n=1 Tax=Gillisia sp. Hel_I_86 TaxID=1249981 RepID=UPI0011994B3D|nr:DUF2062 domain-containing protein [Gillisia sp. Hel_I_86]TVZ27930.1 glycosyltransferase involved in cell wall biosynthesis [Gillisia sp. Hel_I_86]
MSAAPIFQSRFDALQCCVVIPTYNNERTLAAVIRGVLVYTNNIIIVNDGSVDNTVSILKDFPQLTIFHQPANQGKGNALKKGLQLAENGGYKYAITLDSDGQHYADDLDVFLTELEKKGRNEKEILLVGDRNMGQDGIPGKSSMGNKFSNFWYLVVTGQQLHDTQSGYRLYPLEIVNKIPLYTKKFEFEIEVIVKAVWRKVDVKNIPIKVLYQEGGERVSHFRPFKDIVRIVILYIWFVLVSFLYIHPKNKYQDFKEKGFRKFWKEDVLKSQEPAHKKAAAIALGIFVGISPFWGLHTLLVFVLAASFKLNKVIAFLFSNISIPPLIPIIIYASYQAGSVLTGHGFRWELNLTDFDSTSKIVESLWQYILGSMALAAFISFILWIVFYFLFSITNPKQVIKP